MEVIVQYKIYVVKDSFQNTWSVVTDEDCNDVQICSMVRDDGENIYFESEAHHIEQWCKDNKLDLRVFHKTETFTI